MIFDDSLKPSIISVTVREVRELNCPIFRDVIYGRPLKDLNS